MKTFDLINTPLEGANLIEASAGTGKTFAIAGIFLRLLLEKKFEVNSILVVTFTNAAAAELRTRIRVRIKSARDALLNIDCAAHDAGDALTISILKKYSGTGREEAVRILSSALLNFDDASISTIHSFCSEALARFAFESGALFTTEFTSDPARFTSEAAADYWRGLIFTLPEIVVNALKPADFKPERFEEFIKAWGMGGLKIIPDKEPVTAEETARGLMKLEKEYLSAREFWTANRSALAAEVLDYNNSDLKKILKFQQNLAEGRFRANDKYFSEFNPQYPDNQLKLKYFTFSDTPRAGLPDDSLFKKFALMVDRLIPLINSADELLNEFIFTLNDGAIKFARTRIPVLKERYDLRAFDDIISDTRAALFSASGSALAESLRKKFRAALIDEFQDTDQAQYEIFTEIFKAGDSSLFLIGDPKQAIYAFRGADIFSYMDASESVQNRHTLGTNHRSHQDLVRCVNGLFSQVRNPFLFEQIKFEPVNPSAASFDRFTVNNKNVSAMKIYFIPPDKESAKPDAPLGKNQAGAAAAEFTAADISILLGQSLAGKAMIGSEPVTPSDIAVLTRTHKQAELVKNLLGQYSVPSVIYGEHSVFDTPQAEEMLALMKGVAEPSDLSALKRALATMIAGRTSADIIKLNSDDNIRAEEIEKFSRYRIEWVKRGFMPMIQLLMSEEDARRRILSRPDGERILTDILHIAELLHSYEAKEGLGIERLTSRLAEKIYSTEKEKSEENQLRLETDEEAVKIVTVHASKGLQYSIVYLPFAFDSRRYELNTPSRLHDPLTREALLAVSVPDSDEEAARLTAAGAVESLAEEMRLLYVAITRARYAVNLFWGRICHNLRAGDNKPFASAMSLLFHSDETVNADDIISDLDARLNAYTSAKVYEETAARAGIAGVEVIPLPAVRGKTYQPSPAADGPAPSVRQFAGEVKPAFLVTSYSALTSSRSTDSSDEIKSEARPQGSIQKDIYNFPKGASPGSCIHSVFERADFSTDKKNILRQKITSSLLEYGFSEDWTDSLEEMFLRTVSAPLKTDTREKIILSTVEKKSRISELEFYIKTGAVSAETIEQIISAEETRSSRYDITGVELYPGYLHGFIDLVFSHGGRYYIIDWKSNHLGYTAADYTREKINHEMYSAGYMIQYHIYAAALDRWLKASLKDYDYEKNFGGIFYLFVRGIGENTGVYFDRPRAELIDRLNDYFDGSPQNEGTAK